MSESDRPNGDRDAPAASAEGRRGKSRRKRRLALRTLRLIAAALIVLLLAGWWALESDLAAERLRALIETQGSRTLGAPVRIGSLDIDVLPFHLELHDVQVGDLGSAERLAIDLSPLGLIDNRLVVLNLEADSPEIQLDLPRESEDGAPSAAGGPLEFEIRRLRVNDGRLVFAHRELQASGVLEGIRVRLAPEREGLFAGPFAAGVGELRVTDGRLDLTERYGPDAVLSPIEIRAVYGLRRTGLIVDDAVLVAGGSRLEARGTIESLDSAELSLQADLRIEDVTRVWEPPFEGANAGRLRFLGNLAMRAGDPVLSGRLSGEEATVAGLLLDRLSTDLQVHSEQVALRNLEAELLGGALAGSLRVDTTTSPGVVSLDYTLVGLDAATLTRWDALAGWRLAGRVDAEGELTWSRPFGDTATGRGSLRIDLPGADTLAVARRLAEAYRPGARLADPEDAARELHGVPSLPIPVNASVDYRLAAGTVVVQDSTFELPDTTIVIDGRADLDGELLGAVRIDSRDLRMLDLLAVQVRAATGAEEPMRIGLRGAATATLDLRGTVANPVVSGNVNGRGIAVADLEVGNLVTTLRPAPGALVLDPLQVTRNGGSVTGSARIGLGDAGEYSFDLAATGYDLAVEPEVAARSLDLRALVSGTVSARGRLGAAPEMTFDLRSTDLVIDRVGLASARLTGSVGPDRWRLDELYAEGLEGELRGALEWRPASRSLSADLVLEDLGLSAAGAAAGAGADLAGYLSGELSAEGPLETLEGEATFVWEEAGAEGLPMGTVVVAARAAAGLVAARALGDPDPSARLDPPAFPVVTAVADTPDLPQAPAEGWSAAATLSTSEPWPTTLRLRSRAGVAATLLESLGQPLPAGADYRGQLVLDASGPLADLADWSGSAVVDDFRLELPPDFYLATDRLEIELEDRRLTTAAMLDSGVGPFRVVAEADLAGDTLSGTISGTIDAAALRLYDEALEVTGTADVAVDLAGRLSAPIVTGNVTVAGFGIDKGWKYPIADVSAELQLRGDVVRLVRLDGLAGGNPVTGSGVVPLAALTEDPLRSEERLSLDFQVEQLPIGPVLEDSEALSSLVSGGSISADVHVEGRGLDWRVYDGRVAIGELAIRMRDYDWALQGRVEAPLRGGRVVFPEGTRVVGTRTDFGLTGHVELAPLRLDLNVDGRLGLEPLNVLSEVWGTGGTARADLRVYGPVDDLLLRGTAALQDVVLSPPPLRQPIEDIDAELTFEDRRIRIAGLTGELGGGPVSGSGELFLRDNAPQSFRFVLAVDNALVRLERDVRVRASADVVHDGTPERSLLSGSVRLIEGRYRRDLEADDAILEILEAPETDPDPVLASVHLDLQVDGDRGLLIDNNLAQVEVTADFQVVGTLAEPILLGRSVILDGELFWNDNDFEVLQGAVEFNNPFRTEPFFEIRARTDIRRYTVDLNFSGSFERGIAFDYSSTPTLSDLDLFNLLAFGEEPDSAVFQDPYAYQQALGLQATRYLTDAYFTEVERGAARLFGVDRFRIAPTLTGSETDATARLTIGKRISSDLYVTYSRLLSNSEEQLLTVEYQLSSTVRLKGTRDEDGSFGVDFLVQKRIR